MNRRRRAFEASSSHWYHGICLFVFGLAVVFTFSSCVEAGLSVQHGTIGPVVNMPLCVLAGSTGAADGDGKETNLKCGRGWTRIDVDGEPQCAPDTAVWGLLPAVPTGVVVQGDGTAFHAATGLIWQLHVPEVQVHTWTEAFQYCNTLELAGRQDWRLPTMTELSSISVMFCEDDQQEDGLCGEPPMKTAKDLWSATRTAGDDQAMAFVAGGQDFILMAKKSSVIGTKFDDYGVRCVRGGHAVADPTQHMVVTSPSTAFDKRTGLTWMRCAFADEVTLSEGRALCSALPITAGESAWRLPSARELETLIERDGVKPEVSSVFASTDIESSRMVAAHPKADGTVAFRLGTGEIVSACSISAMGCPNRRRVQCVRGPQT